jgi:anaphase-promoting complex subunit 8
MLSQSLVTCIQELLNRGLYESARWCIELNAALNEKLGRSEESNASLLCDTNVELLLCYFDAGDYSRLVHCVDNNNSNKSQESRFQSTVRFLRWHALYKLGESEVLCSELNSSRETLDSFDRYLYALALSELKRDDDVAYSVLCQSVDECPLHWCAWVLRAQLEAKDDNQRCGRGRGGALTVSEQLEAVDDNQRCGGDDDSVLTLISSTSLQDCEPRALMVAFYAAFVCLERRDDEAVRLYAALERFVGGDYVRLQLARAYFAQRDFEMAEELFERLRASDPYSLDGVDAYSNILFVNERVADLNYLAHAVFSIDRSRPESCLVVGNYFGLHGAHARAVDCYRRALRVDPGYLWAWTLLGLESVELRNTSAAIAAFRRAVDIDRREYRAWYGLGKCYELRRMPHFALYYFEKASAIRPRDPRMLIAIAAQHEALGGASHTERAIQYYRRAHHIGDAEGVAITKLARLYGGHDDDRKRAALAAHYHALVVRCCDELREVSPRLSEALWFLAQHARRTGQLSDAKAYCIRLQDFHCKEAEEGKSLLRQIQNEEEDGRSRIVVAAGGASSSHRDDNDYPSMDTAVLQEQERERERKPFFFFSK